MNKTLPYITSIAIFVIASFVLEPWLADTRRGKSHSIRVLAATTVATPSATPSATPTVITITPSQTQDIQEKIH